MPVKKLYGRTFRPEVHTKTPAFGVVKREPKAFLVRHCPGDVEYSSVGFLGKNMDNLSQDCLDVLDTSTSPIMPAMLKPVQEAAAKAGAARRGTLKKKATVSSQFASSLKELMEAIRQTDPHFIRCIKTNPQKEAGNFDREYVLEQLRKGGVLQAVEARLA